MTENKARLDITDERRRLEKLFSTVNTALDDQEEELIEYYTSMGSQQPLLFICYAPRSGSTLFSQTLAASQKFNYITNLVARFWKAPLVAMELQKSLKITSGNVDTQPGHQYQSTFGATSGISQPHEFGFFWNSCIPYGEASHFVEKDAFSERHLNKTKRHLNAICRFSEKPFFVKNAIAGINVHVLKRVFPSARFLIILREPDKIAQSILRAREKLFGDKAAWWSLMPATTSLIREKKPLPEEQVVCQVRDIYNTIFQGLEDVNSRCAVVEYESFCAEPAEIVGKLLSFLNVEPELLELAKKIPTSFQASRHIYIEKDEYSKILQAIDELEITEVLQKIRSRFNVLDI
ncbi:MAG: sulfotransferase [Calditrichota bacterium]